MMFVLKVLVLVLMVVLAVVGIRKAIKAYRKERAIREMMKKTAQMFEVPQKLSPIAEYYAANVTFRP